LVVGAAVVALAGGDAITFSAVSWALIAGNTRRTSRKA